MILLVLPLLLLAAPATSLAQEPAPEDSPAVSSARPGLERRQTLPPPGLIPPAFSVNGVLRGGAQWIVNPPRAKDDVFGFGAFDAILIWRLTPNVTLLADVEAIVGPGPDAALGTLSLLNAETERLFGDDTKVFLREAWIRLQSSDASIRFNVGKLDVTHYFDRNFFAEDETRQFLNAALAGNPLLGQPRNGPGTALRISQGDWRYAFGVHAPGDVDDDLSGLPYFIAELGRRRIFPLVGHYRWWARVGSVPEHRDDLTWGTGLSIDQLVIADTGVFVRAGLSRSEGESLTSHAWSAGVQHTPSWLGRAKDLAGVGYSFLRQPEGREQVAEAYYNLSLADCCAIIANVQWILSGPNLVSGRRNRDVVVPGLRALISF
jgi:Carbohydrate-selective porin, OprB family